MPAQNLKDFTAYAKANAGKLNYSSVGLGNPRQLASDTQLMVDVAGSERPKPLPEVPTVAESSAPGFHAATLASVAQRLQAAPGKVTANTTSCSRRPAAGLPEDICLSAYVLIQKFKNSFGADKYCAVW